MNQIPPRGTAFAALVSVVWGALLPVFFFLSGGAGFFYEVLFGHDAFWGFACALWAAGGPALVAEKLLRGLR